MGPSSQFEETQTWSVQMRSETDLLIEGSPQQCDKKRRQAAVSGCCTKLLLVTVDQRL